MSFTIDSPDSLGTSLDGQGKRSLHTKTSLQGQVITVEWDALTTSYPDQVTEIYYLKQGGLSGTIVSTITITYTDDTKNLLDTFKIENT